MLDKTWLHIIDNIDFAFQPIVDINNGKTVAYEALLRNYKEVGFDSIDSFFDTAYEEKILHTLDLKLRKKVLKKIINSKLYDKNIKIFYNLDNRIIEMPNYKEGQTSKILDKLNIDKNILTFEISEKHKFRSFIEAQTVFNLYQEQGYQIALDDFGTGFSGLKLLYYLNPNHIKIDRFFITDIFKDQKKKLFLKNIINIAKSINSSIIAEGIETQEELDMCHEIGCNSVQGYYIQRPSTNIDELKKYYPIIDSISHKLNPSKKNLNDLNNSYELSKENENQDNFSHLLNEYIILSTADLNGTIKTVSNAFSEISGYQKDDLIGQNHNVIKHPNTPKSKFIDLWKTIEAGNIWTGELQNLNKNDDEYWLKTMISPSYNNLGHIDGYISISHDISEKKKLEKITIIDHLTGLYNKTYFHKILAKKMNNAQQNNSNISLILFEIDDFKKYNKSNSYQQGDKILKKIAQKITSINKEENSTFRIGGKEFALLLENKNKKNTIQIAATILEEINELKIKYLVGKEKKQISLSSGIVCLKGNQIDENTNLLISADISLCKAKSYGSNQIEVSTFTYKSSIINA